MKIRTRYALIFAACLFVANHFATAGEQRTWTAADGIRTIKAEFVRASDGMVTLRNSSGKLKNYRLDKFSEEDAKWVEEQLKSISSALTDPPVATTSNDYTELVTGRFISSAWSRNYLPPQFPSPVAAIRARHGNIKKFRSGFSTAQKMMW